MSATGSDSATNFRLMKDTVSSIIERYGIGKVRYSVILFGDTIGKPYGFGDKLPGKEDLMNLVLKLPKRSLGKGKPVLAGALKKALDDFNGAKVRAGSTKVLVVMMDNKSGLVPDDLRRKSQPLHDKGVVVVPVAISNTADPTALVHIVRDGKGVIAVPKTEDPDRLADRIMREVYEGKINHHFLFYICFR